MEVRVTGLSGKCAQSGIVLLVFSLYAVCRRVVSSALKAEEETRMNMLTRQSNLPLRTAEAYADNSSPTLESRACAELRLRAKSRPYGLIAFLMASWASGVARDDSIQGAYFENQL